MDAELQTRLNNIESTLKKIHDEVKLINKNQANNFYTLNDNILKAISNAIREIKS